MTSARVVSLPLRTIIAAKIGLAGRTRSFEQRFVQPVSACKWRGSLRDPLGTRYSTWTMAGSGETIVEGDLDAKGARVAIVVSRFNAFITERLLDGAIDTLCRLGAERTAITVIRVPGAFEIPQTASQVVATRKHDALIALGCLIRGDTIHFELIAAQVTRGLAVLGMGADVPVVFGVLTTDTLEQAIHRAGGKYGNKGAEVAQAAVEQLQLFRKLKKVE